MPSFHPLPNPVKSRLPAPAIAGEMKQMGLAL